MRKKYQNTPLTSETDNLPDKEFKVIVIKMLNRVDSRIEELRENLKKGLENIIKNQSQLRIQ